MLAYREFTTHQDYLDSLVGLLKLEEGFNPVVKNIGDGKATIGHGYTFNRNDNVTIWKQSGITLSASDWDTLNKIDAAKTSSSKTAIAITSFHHQLTLNEARNLLLATEPHYESIVTNHISMPDSLERAALVSMVYTNEAIIGSNLESDINSGNRAEAWYEIRYRSNLDKQHANRRYLESHTFSLYNDEKHVTKEDAEQVAMMYTSHRKNILAYESTYKPSVADTNYNKPGIKDIYGELKPAIDEFKSIYGIQINTPLKEVQIASHTQDSIAPNLLGGSNNDLLIGDSNDNILNGGAGNDVLIGNGGNDTFICGAGNDTVICGGGLLEAKNKIIFGDGKDTVKLVYSTLAQNIDTFVNTSKIDKIDLSDYKIHQLLTNGEEIKYNDNSDGFYLVAPSSTIAIDQPPIWIPPIFGLPGFWLYVDPVYATNSTKNWEVMDIVESSHVTVLQLGGDITTDNFIL